jgi:flagellin-like protein
MKTAKKAVSPIITTVLLILVAIILAIIILVWARGFIAEKVSKFIPEQQEDRPISEACTSPSLSLSVAINGDNELSLINQGDIPVYKIGVRVTASGGESTIVEYDATGLNPGQSKSIATPTQHLTGNKIAIVPILIGKSEKKGTVEYNCKNWAEVTL